MASFPPEPPGEVPIWGAPPTPAEIRQHLASQPRPTLAQEYDLAEAEFWRHRHLPAGSVLVFSEGFVEETSTAECAMLVKEVKDTAEGLWVRVKVLGCSEKEFKKTLSSHFKKGRLYVHLCPGASADCPQLGEEACHVDKFFWYPPGDFAAAWLDSAARKAVTSGKELAQEEAPGVGEAAPRRTGFTTLTDRLRRLKEKETGHVTFVGAEKAPLSSRRADLDLATYQGGTTSRRATANPAQAALADAKRVKSEPIMVPSEDEGQQRGKTKSKRTRRISLDASLAKAANSRRSHDTKRERRSRSRSKRGKKKRKRRRKRSSSSQDSRGSRTPSSVSSSDSLVPPLKKRAQRDPGSVFKMLESQAVEQLSQDGILEEDFMEESKDGRRVKMFTYFQLALKPGLDPKSRDCREISLLARCLDLLREGRLAHLADTLAARLLAVETATKQGWGTAKFLEIYGADEEGPVPAQILLSAQRHQKQVERAGGKGSWPKSNQWSWSDWGTDPRPKGKGKEPKGKGKKGKNKGKGKGGSDQKGDAEKPKAGET